MKYDRPVRELLGECVAVLPEPFSRAEILGWFRARYPGLAAGTVSAHVQAFTDGPGRARSHPGLAHLPPLVERVGHGLYRRAGAGVDTPACGVASVPVAIGGPPVVSADVVLVGCVKTKGAAAAAARELYRGALFERRRRWAQAAGRRWFIISSRWGLVEPEEVIAPYELYLADQPVAYRRAWAGFVTAALERVCGPLAGWRVEIHAGDAYVAALRPALTERGAVLIDPVDAHSMGETLAWYDHHQPPRTDQVTPSAPAPAGDVEEDAELTELDVLIEGLAGRLSEASAAVSVPDLLAAGPDPLSSPGLYSWWVDEPGSRDLSAGLGLPVPAGLIYLGQAGATRRPSGKPSTNTLWNRLAGMHLAGQAEYSTFRRTLAAALRGPLRLPTEDDPRLSQWIRTHLSVIAVPHLDPDVLGLLERAVAHRLDPPLNLAGLPPTPTRTRLSALRATRSRT